MPTSLLRRALWALLACLPAGAQDLPLGLNLPRPMELEAWQLGIRFTHRFEEKVRSNGKEAGGLDGYAYAALGLDLGLGGVPGLNLQLYRSADQKTFVAALQKSLFASGPFRASVRAERWDEGVRGFGPSPVEAGKLGGALQLPVEAELGAGLRILAVPTWLTRTHTGRDGVFNVGGGLSWEATPSQALSLEFYPVPSKVQGRRVVPWPDGGTRFEAGWALGYTLRTRGHRFSVMATTSTGSTASQVLAGDHNGVGARRSGDWGLGFNVVRIF